MPYFSFLPRATHSDRLERWIGKDQAERISLSMRNWHGSPVAVSGVPGSVWACRGGDFQGPIQAGRFGSAADYVRDRWNRSFRRWLRSQLNVTNAGFANISELIAEATAGKMRHYDFYKVGPTGVANVTSSLWRVSGQPGAGAAPGNAPGGTAFTDASAGGFPFTNPTGGDTQHLVSACLAASVAGNCLLLYDLIFGCNKTMNSTSTEAVTGAPSRYQSTTPGDMDYAGSNFLFVQVGGTALAATAHNWTVCQYTDQDGNTGVTLPSLTGNSGAIVDRLDHPTNQWFAPLAAGDSGIKALTQMQCSAAVATGVIWFMIGHPIAFFPTPSATLMLPFDGIMSAFNLVRIFDDACLAFLEVIKPSTTATFYTGRVNTVAG
jgi:hypothetical protein